MLVQADTTNGIYEVRALDDFNAPKIVDEKTFYDSLKTLGYGEELAAQISPEIAEKISNEYGITLIK